MDSASAVICWGNKVLLFHRDDKTDIYPNHWQFPGGGIENGETPIQGLKRELLEEVSYIPKKITFIGKKQGGDGTTYVYTSFINKSEAQRFKIGKTEGRGIGFFTIDQALKLKLIPVIRSYITKSRNEIEKSLKQKFFQNTLLKQLRLLKKK